MSLVSTLVTDVANILRRDNLDLRILDWIGMAYNDAVTRYPSWISNQYGAATITSSGQYGAWLGGYALSNPLVGVFVDSNSVFYTPKLVPMTDFGTYSHSVNGGSFATGTTPVLWSYGPPSREAALSAGSEVVTYVYPVNPSSDYFVQVVYQGQYLSAAPAMTDQIRWPAHFDHVLVWGAAYFGAMMVKREIAPIAMSKYESSLRSMATLLSYKPDATPQKREVVSSAYEGGSVYPGARFPDTISG